MFYYAVMAGMNDRPQPPHVLRWQSVLNEHWPARPGRFKDRSPEVAVRVRVVWERDGKEYIDGHAVRWDGEHIYVRIRDTTGRLPGQGVWVKPSDVYRSADAAELS